MIKRTYFISCEVIRDGKAISCHWRVFDKISWFKIPDGVVIESIILDIATEIDESVQNFNAKSFNRL